MAASISLDHLPITNHPQDTHPLGSRTKVLLTSVFGPFARDDEYGSRKINPMELWHNQVTRVQGPFSLRMFNRSWGLMMIQANIEAPCVLLDFPTLDRFVSEIREHHYDVVGISAIPPNVLKVEEMCRVVRKYQPEATIVVGGHVVNLAGIEDRVDADWIVRGEGVRWFRRFLREDPERHVYHPRIKTGVNVHTMGSTAGSHTFPPTATVIPSVGCPLGCNFCSTSALFGGKGNFISFYETGDELFSIMHQLEESMNVQSFFVMDENFLLHRRRALRLLELMEANDKAWSLQIFSSANVVRSYSVDQLVSLGLSWLWLGLEGENSQYSKLDHVDTFELVRELQSHGVRVLGSTIIGLEHHLPENMDKVIDYAVRHASDFHQFMLYSPSPGTPLYHELDLRGQLKTEEEFPWPNWHGQLAFSWRHPHIKDGQETESLLRAFQRDFEVNGPSIVRTVQTMLKGWRRYKDHPDPRIRRRFTREARGLRKAGVAAVAATREYYHDKPALRAKMSALLDELCEQFGDRSRQIAEEAMPYLLEALRIQEKKMADGWVSEPPTFYEINSACQRRFADEYPQAAACLYVTPPAPVGLAVES
jgi:radical SAM superfamily enzyme YgiQ (UPF0313 family)